MKEKIKVEYLTIDGKTHTFETFVTRTTREEYRDDEVITEILNHAIKFFSYEPVKEHEE